MGVIARTILIVVIALVAAGCGTRPRSVEGTPAGQDGTRSMEPLSDQLPKGWAPLVILRDRPQTRYRLVNEEGGPALHAHADGASSALMHELESDPHSRPWLGWSWKIRRPSRPPEEGSPQTMGSPARIVLGFDGDKDKLSFREQMLFETARVVTGHEFPYATLMYVWSSGVPAETVVHSRHSSRIRMIVVESGAELLGEWRHFQRNVVADFMRAFGEEPGNLLGIGVLTDDDAFQESTEAWYGNIRLSPEPFVRAEPGAVPHPGDALFLSQRE